MAGDFGTYRTNQYERIINDLNKKLQDDAKMYEQLLTDFRNCMNETIN